MSNEFELLESEGAVFLPVKAQPGSRRNEFRGISQGRLKVCVTQVAEKGKANKAIIKLLAKLLSVSVSKITLVKGELSSLKTFRIDGLDAKELLRRIDC